MVKLFMRGSWMLCLLNGVLAVVTRLLASVPQTAAPHLGHVGNRGDLFPRRRLEQVCE